MTQELDLTTTRELIRCIRNRQINLGLLIGHEPESLCDEQKLERIETEAMLLATAARSIRTGEIDPQILDEELLKKPSMNHNGWLASV